MISANNPRVMTTRQLIIAQREINSVFIRLRDRGAIVDAIYSRLRGIENEIGRRDNLLRLRARSFRRSDKRS